MLTQMRELNEAFFGLIHSLDSPLLRQFPLLARLPFRIFRFQRVALGHADRESAFFLSLLDQSRQAYKQGSLPPCGARNFFDEEDQTSLSMKEVAYAFGSLYGASVDPPKILLDTIGLALMTHPSVVQAAHTELDARWEQSKMLPTYADLASLPYCRAIFLEALRWRTVAPIGLPHSTTATDTYRGWTIPKGCVVIGNALAMHNDLSQWDEPEVSQAFDGGVETRCVSDWSAASSASSPSDTWARMLSKCRRRPCMDLASQNGETCKLVFDPALSLTTFLLQLLSWRGIHTHVSPAHTCPHAHLL